jgi:hypothetical protein
MELAGLEPATSWVRSRGFGELEASRLQRFSSERLRCRNICPNNLHPVRHYDDAFAASDRNAGYPRVPSVACPAVTVTGSRSLVAAKSA